MNAGPWSLPRLRWRPLLWIALALVAIVVLRKHQSSYEQRDAPLLQPAPASDAVGRNFRVEVGALKVVHAYLLNGPYPGDEALTLRTPGIWLSVLAKVEATQTQGMLTAQLRTRSGRVYVAAGAERPRLPAFNLSGRELAPGLQEVGAWFFELPPDQLQGAHLQLFWGTSLPVGGDSLVDVDLGLDAARARGMLEEAKPVLDLRQ